jgi:microcystin-dependent protein
MKAPVVAISSGQETLFGIGQSIAGIVIADMDRVAINAQTDPTENGIYNARGGKDWERATDFNNPDDVENGQLLSDGNTSAVYSIIAPDPWNPGVDVVNFGLLLSPVGFFWGAITGTISNQADLQIELDAKSDVGHGHVEADISDLQAYILDAAGSIASDGEFYARRNADWEVIDFSVFAPAVHGHVEADISDLGAYLLDAAGSIANDNQLWARANGAWQAFSTSSGTTGEIIAWPDADVPQNFLDCNGQLLNAVTFADLFAVLGYKYGGSGSNFNVPDLRGQFIRGTANGSGQDPDRLARTDRGDGATGDLVGTKQSYELQLHGHTVPFKFVGSTEGGGGDLEVRAQNTPTSNTGGSETRPRNINMNYIIRYTGGGSGITQPPSIEVQDDGVNLTTAVQLLNFIGFNLEQPILDQINISFGASVNNATYCPNYAFNFIDTTSWSIIGFDATNLFSVGRRLRFVDGASNYFGTILSSAFGADTTMNMSMESGDVLTSTITEVCLVNGGVAWQPISQDPFGGTAIRGIETGSIGVTQYWVICGDAGKVAFSTDAGLTWTVATTGTSENLNDVAYNRDDESFLVVGNTAVLLHSTDGENFALDTSSIPALPEFISGQADIYSCMYDRGGQGYRVQWAMSDVAQTGNAYTTDDTATWDSTPNIGTKVNVGEAKIGAIKSGLADTDLGMFYQQNIDLNQFGIIPDETGSSFVNVSSQAAVRGCRSFVDQNGSTVRIFVGRADGEIFHNTSLADDVTFGSSGINAFVESLSLERMIGVADDGKIGFCDQANYTANDAWQLVQNGSNPLASFTDVMWNEVDGMYVAVNDQGQILRSTNGLDTLPPPAPFVGWTAIAQDPFSGGNIQHIATGVIGGTEYWVIAGSTLIFTSVDAGVTWVSRTSGVSGSITTLKYDNTNEAFIAGCSNGDFTRTTNGTTWVADTTTVQAIPGLTGSGRFNGMVWSPGAALWSVFMEFNLATTGSLTANADMTVWAQADLTTNATGSGPDNTMVYDGLIGGRTIYAGHAISYVYYSDPTDNSPISLNNMSEPVTAAFSKLGTLGDIQDLFIGDNVGDIELMSSTTVRAVNDGALNGPVNAFSYSSVADRMIAVGNAGEIKTQSAADLETVGTWRDVTTPFGGNINDVDYNVSDDIFICVCADGVIARSVDGIS